MKKTMKHMLRHVLFAVAFGVMVLFNTGDALAAEYPMTPGNSTGNAPSLNFNTDYYAVNRSGTDYVKFTTPAQNGYTRITVSSINLSDGLYADVETISGALVEETSLWYANRSHTWLLKLEPNTTYYIKVTPHDKRVGNWGVKIIFNEDKEGTSKANGKPINLNTVYTFSKELDADEDYFVFTAPSTGRYRVSLSNIDGGSFYAGVYAYASDRKYGETVTNYYKDDTKYRDYQLEAGTKYYIKITGDTDNNVSRYGLLVSNQKATKIQLSQTYLEFSGASAANKVLTATVLPAAAMDKSVKWSSSNTNVAYVYSDGEVNPNGAGRAVITCTSADDPNVKATCTVVVKPNQMYTPYVNFSKKTGTSYITLNWSKLSGADGYTIYQYTGKKWKAIKNLSASHTSYKVSKLKAGTTYKFRIAAYVLNGKTKVYGPKSSVFTTSTNPGKATLQKVENRGKNSSYYRRVYLKAKSVKGVTGYQFAYSSSRSGYYYTVSTPAKTGGTTSLGFYIGRNFYFKVRAYRTVGGNTYYGAWSTPKRLRIQR